MKLTRLRALLALGTVGLGVPVGIALATPGSGIVAAPVIARATVDVDNFKLKLRNSSNSADAVIQQVTIAPGGQTGWHTHPGPAVVLVTSGRFTVYQADDRSCSGRTYLAGQSFVDPGYGNVHIGRNEGATNVELWVAYLDVPVGGAFRIDTPAPGNCGF
jgi:mannose-6-phosphate isomerase-like protein (cupin superfamily)